MRAKRDGDSVIVTIKVGGMVYSRVSLSVAVWPSGLYDQRRTAVKALGEAIGIPESEWTSPELDRIPSEIVKAMREMT